MKKEDKIKKTNVKKLVSYIRMQKEKKKNES